MRRAAIAAMIAIAAVSRVDRPPIRVQADPSADPRARLHTTIDPVIDALWAAYDEKAAFDDVRFISPFWRLPGNAGFNASLDRIHRRLTAAGLPRVTFEEFPNPGRGWDHTAGTLAIARAGQPDDVVLSREKERLALCINSFSTAPGGVVAPLVDVGRGDRDEDYAGKDLRGAVVLGDADAGQLWRRAVVSHGALGIVSTAMAAYVRPDPPGANATPRDEWDILQWSSIPYDESRKGFGFKASPRAAARLRRALAAQTTAGGRAARPAGREAVSVRVTIVSAFSTAPVRTLVAEMPGRVAPDERLVLAAHVQEPGANDNASGVATLAELASSMMSRIRQGSLAPPARTLTFLFLTEIGGSRQWLQDHPADAKRVKYMFSLDMTGEDTTKTGGSFLIERYPDPGAVWDRPWDPHSEWGRGNVRAEQLSGDLLNDVHLAICLRVGRKTAWVVKTNPYEGGSDHTVFGAAGIPSVLDWHFTDRYYHTNFDTPDKTSAAEMQNVGVAVGATAWLLASATESMALDVARVVAAAGQSRIALEQTEGDRLASADRDPVAAKSREATIVQAWRKWYTEAVRSAARLVVGPTTAGFEEQLKELATSMDGRVLLEGRASARPDAGPAEAGPSFFQAQPNTTLRTCGEDEKLPAPILLSWETVVLAGDSRGFMPCTGPEVRHDSTHREAREATVISQALIARDPELRRLAVQAYGRFWTDGVATRSGPRGRIALRCDPIQQQSGESAPWSPGTVLQRLADNDPRVRREAASAVGDISAREPAGTSDRPNSAIWTRLALESCLKTETDPHVAGTILETMGRLNYPDDAARDAAEAALVAQSTGAPAKVLGAAKGLESLIRRSPRRPVSLAAILRLRELVFVGSLMMPVPTIAGVGSAAAPGDEDMLARTRRLALLALQAARDDDPATHTRASLDADWQVRRLVALRLDFGRGDHAAISERLARDQIVQVRDEVVSALGRHATKTRECAPLIRFLGDSAPAVVLHAIDLFPATCTDGGEGIEKLKAWTESLGRPESVERWHVPARALVTLARIQPESARAHLKTGAEHPAWQVRAAAAAAAALVKDEAVVAALAADAEPNVRTASLEELRKLKSPLLAAAAVDALKSDDYQLLLKAATVLQAAAESLRQNAVDALLSALRRLTNQETDTSRDPRVAILQRLEELMPADRSADLLRFASDFDPQVRAAAAKAFTALVGTAPRVDRTHRYRYQPSPAELAALPRNASIDMEGGGTIELELLVDQAPVTVARFAELVRSGYYNGLTFHRVVPNFVIQGGSPGANEYMGTARYMRDEPGTEPHVRGAVGISTRGRDTGDAQIFIDLVDLPRLDHDYTVFARVLTGLDVVDRILEGAKIRGINLK